MSEKISIVVPALNEAGQITKTLTALLPFRHAGHEVIVADGGSHDDTCDLAWAFCDKIIRSPAGRAAQMNAGAAEASGDLLVFLHADSRLPKTAPQFLKNLLEQHQEKVFWGRFNVRLSGSAPAFRLIEFAMNLRSRISGIATGDQAIFIHKVLFKKAGGFENIPLMEDIALSRSLKKLSRPLCLKETLITSSRRWEENGILKTIFLMWGLRLAYFLGVSPHRLKRYY